MVHGVLGFWGFGVLGQNGNGREDEADEMEELKVCDYVSNRGVPDLSLVQSMPVHKIEAHHI